MDEMATAGSAPLKGFGSLRRFLAKKKNPLKGFFGFAHESCPIR